MSLALLLLLPLLAAAQTPYRLSDGTYTESFAGIADWAADFASGEGAAPFSPAAPSPTLPSQNRVFSTGTSGGVQKGSGSIVLLATGSTDGQNAAAFDLALDFTGTEAGTLSLDWAAVSNSTGNRRATFSIQANTGGDGAFEEVPGSAVTIANNPAAPMAGALTQLALPASLSGRADARLRFFLVTSEGTETGDRASGSRPKISLDNLQVTATAAGDGGETTTEPAVSVSVSSLPDFGSIEVGSVSGSRTFTVSGQNLTGDVVITPAPGFEIRIGDNPFACCAITLSPVDGTLESTTVEVRFAPAAAQSYSDNIIIGGADAQQQVAVTGTGIAAVYPATLSTAQVTDVTYTTATAGGQIASDGGSPVTARGTVWSTEVNPTVEGDPHTTDGEGTGAFTSSIAGLQHGTVYYARAYATNAVGTAYGQERTFTTAAVELAAEPTAPSSVTVSEVGGTSMKLSFGGGDGAKRLVLARIGGEVDAVPEDAVTYTADAAFRQGQEIGAGNFAIYSGTGNEVTVTGLRGSTEYHFAVFEYNDNDTEAAENYLTSSVGRARKTTEGTAGFLAFEENFDYTPQTLLTDNGWAAHSGGATNAIPVADAGLSYEGYASSGIGNSAEIRASGQDVNRGFDAMGPGEPVYTAFLVNVSQASAGGDYFLHLGPSSLGTTFRNRVYVRSSAEGGVQFGISGSGSEQAYTEASYDLNTTYLIVTKYAFDETGSTATLYVNPAGAEPSEGQAVMAEAGDRSPADIGTIALRQGSSSPVLTLDGIRVGTSYSLVTGFEEEESKTEQEIAFGPIEDRTFGDAPFALTATASSELPVTLTVVSGPATLEDGTLTLTGAGQVRVRASQAGNEAFAAAADVERAFCVRPVTPTVEADGTVLRVANHTEGTTAYQWYLNGAAIEGATESSHAATEPGSYTVTATVGECVSEPSAAQVLTPTGIRDELLTKGAKAYPVPATDRLHIEAGETGSGTAKVRLYDLAGRLVLTQQVRTAGTLQTELKVGSLQRGLYVLVVETPKGFITKKITLR
ncbi:T9SS type A sorting domain-containing protein [Pontibacter harenae]|uniref:T9SS type A sorting domain-containing protein n=1 Tax=Pontibacter harenae TaxID=2894083 RepID=UPI001E38504C|nr:T9SS type A sorting domain-containing protein [Pontibacter harenae]MCC9167880.1 T9SS type A sorting domain-containing protein [Pontibacter harenae]